MHEWEDWEAESDWKDLWVMESSVWVIKMICCFLFVIKCGFFGSQLVQICDPVVFWVVLLQDINIYIADFLCNAAHNNNNGGLSRDDAQVHLNGFEAGLNWRTTSATLYSSPEFQDELFANVIQGEFADRLS